MDYPYSGMISGFFDMTTGRYFVGGAYKPLNEIPKPQSPIDVILNYGREEAKGISEISNKLVSYYDSESDKLIGTALTKLHSATEAFGVARGIVPWIARKTHIKYDFKISEKDLMRGKEVINGVVKELNNNLANVKADVENVDLLISSLQDYYAKLGATIKVIDERLMTERETLTANTFESNILRRDCEEVIRMLEQKKIDLQESQQTSEIIASQLMMVKSNNFDLYCLLMSRIVSRVPTMLASVTVKTMMNRGRRTLGNIKSFDRGSDKLLKSNMKDINDNLKDTLNQTAIGSIERIQTLQEIKTDILATTIEVKTIREGLIKKQHEELEKLSLPQAKENWVLVS